MSATRVHPRRDTYSPARGRRRRLRRRARVSSSSPRSATATSPRASRGTSPAIRPRCRTCSASARSRRTASVPDFSNRDAHYNDITAPGEGDPLDAAAEADGAVPHLPRPGLLGAAGRRTTGPPRARRFAAPQVTAAAAMLLSVDPALDAGPGVDDPRADARPTRTPATAAGSARSAGTRYTGWGRLERGGGASRLLGGHVARSRLARAERRCRRRPGRSSGLPGTIDATLDFWDDQSDVYRDLPARGQRLFAVLSGPHGRRHRRSRSGSPGRSTWTTCAPQALRIGTRPARLRREQLSLPGAR